MRLVERSDSEHEYFVDSFRDADSETFGFGEFSVAPTDLSFSFVRSAGPAFDESFRIREGHQPEPVGHRGVTTGTQAYEVHRLGAELEQAR